MRAFRADNTHQSRQWFAFIDEGSAETLWFRYFQSTIEDNQHFIRSPQAGRRERAAQAGIGLRVDIR